MAIGEMLSDSFEYTKEALVGKWEKWVLLIICSIIFPLIMGYMLRVMKGEKPAPEIEDWAALFIDGIKLLIIGIIYAIPIMIVAFLIMAGTLMSGDLTAMLVGLLVLVILSIIIYLVAIIGMLRFANTGAIGEAFNFNEILATIKKIGWVNYIIALIVVYVIIGVIEIVCMAIPFIGWILLFILFPAIAIFASRYFALIYESAGTAA